MKFPSIEQFRTVVKQVQHKAWYTGRDENDYPVLDKERPLPTLSLTGTVKIHGTNGGVHFSPDGKITTLSRKKVITPVDDNAGFAKFVARNEKFFKALHLRIGGEVILYGEWAGRGIQKGTAIQKLEPAFFVFAIKRDNVWLPITQNAHIEYPEARIFNVARFKTFSATIDFSQPKAHLGILEAATEEVEKQCPIAGYFGATGIGEGVVWTFDDPSYNNSRYWFKVKGEKHKVAHTKEKIEVDVEKVKSVNQFVKTVLTQARLEQGLENIDELDKKNTGTFLKWIVSDVLKEETDRMIASELEKSDVTKALSNEARKWFFVRLSDI